VAQDGSSTHAARIYGAVRRDPFDAWQMHGQSITATASTSIR
jgi:hypothetical protein